MSTRLCTMVMNPRRIPECVDSFETLDCDLAWLTGYSLDGLVPAVAEVVAATDYDAYAICADDCIVSQPALDAVTGLLEAGHPVVTGWCRLDSTSMWANLTRHPLIGNRSSVGAYAWRSAAAVAAWPDGLVVPTGFVGFALTAMSRELWRRFPFQTDGQPPDFALSIRLRDADIPMVGARDGFVEHLKERWNFPDRDPRKQLHLRRRPETRIVERTPA